MSAPLYMLHLPLDIRRLIRFGSQYGLLAGRHAFDGGYLVHALLAALFDKAAPKPFALPPSGLSISRDSAARADTYRVLAYSPMPIADLQGLAEVAADPEVYRVLDWEGAADKPMPTMPARTTIGFEVRTSPVRRLGRGATESPGAEVDAYVAARLASERSGGALPERNGVYLDWLRSQIDPVAASLHNPTITASRSVDLVRRSQPSGDEARPMKTLRRPDVTFRGTLEVQDPDRFSAMLARGIGRHRAFGFGMLLLRRLESAG